VAPADADFLFALYASTRAEEFAAVPWSETQKTAFFRQQFAAQDRDYRAHHPPEVFQIILINETPAGRLYLHRAPDELHLLDIALLPAHRQQGLGTFLLRRILAEAQNTGLPVRIYVEHYNPALRLYRRLGFVPVEEHGVYSRMEWRPPT
jgi:ribosomal protein S18 acetylase RimI-like enzyme